MTRFVELIVLSWGWRRLVVAGFAGAVSALAMPPFGWVFVLFLTFPVLVWLLDGASGAGLVARARAAFLIGWAFGFGYFVAGLWWLGAAFLVDADTFAWALPLGVAGLPAFLAISHGVGLVLARLLWSRSPLRIMALAFGLSLAEYLRGTLFTGFPWNAFGHALAFHDVPMQAASLVGLHGLTLVVLVIAAAPAVLFDRRVAPGRRLVLPVLALVALVGIGVFGAVRLSSATTETVPGVMLRIVQPNLTQAERRDRTRHVDILERYVRLTARRGPTPITHVIWPESALPFMVTPDQGAWLALARAIPPNATLIAGLQRPDDRAGNRVFNSLAVIDGDGRLLDRYDKTHLVPFGEYLPFPGLMSAIGLEPLTRVLTFVPGTRRHVITAPGAPTFLPLICYEIIFPGQVAVDGPRAGWIVNLSDDSWFGDTPGPRQHLLQARVRAVEEGLPVVRATTNGISAIVDAHGRVRAFLGSGAEDTLDTPLPASIQPTVYALYRNLLFWLPLATTLVLAIFSRMGLEVREG